ncbi:carboxypeptidase C prc1 [Phytophthora boehmeriae]|uniref:Carboxypeptidase C prc1 n=1 Tax=Phytophthora boehmeriae TaxID=109152 RepID=A0A8T1WVM2_9STRA|nr:carboxypeptidase C prc1 [Phytophthora boehmeriae]
MAEINRLREHLGRLDEKLGTTSSLPNADDVANLSEDHKTMLRSLVQSKSREVRTRRAALLEAVSECVHLAQELQIEAAYVFSAELDARLKKRDLSVDMIQKIAERTVELRDLKTKREAHLAEMHGEIQRLWRELEVPEKDRERFQTTIHGIGKASLASCEAELGRLQRHHKRFSAITIQVTSLREVITKHWDLLGYSPNAREYFAEMMNTADSDLSYKVFRSHEKEAERLKRHLFGMRILTNYVIKREDIAQARADNAVPDEKLRVRIDRDLPRYTAILNERIEKWQKETGLVFCWNGIVHV